MEKLKRIRRLFSGETDTKKKVIFMGHISRRVLTKCKKWPKMTKLIVGARFLKCFEWSQHNIKPWHPSYHLYLQRVRSFFLNIHIQSICVPLKNLPFLRANFDFDPHGNMLKIQNLQFPSNTLQLKVQRQVSGVGVVLGSLKAF